MTIAAILKKAEAEIWAHHRQRVSIRVVFDRKPPGVPSELAAYLHHVVAACAEGFEVYPDLILSNSRKRELVNARYAAFHLGLKKGTPALVARYFRLTDGSHITYGAKACQDRIDTETDYKTQFNNTCNLLAKLLSPAS